MGLAVSLELPLLIIDIQRGGPSTGLPTKTEAADLLHGDVRPPRRVAAADRRRPQPERLLLRRHRGGAHRAQVPHAGDPAVRRLPGQRHRAVAAARRRRRCPTSPPRSPPSRTTSPTTATRCSGPTSATPRRWPGRGRCRARPGLDAPHRRHREGGRLRQHQLRPRQPRAHGPPPGRQGRRHRRRHPAGRGRRATSTTPSCSCSGWGSTWGAIDGAVEPGARRAAARSPTPTCATSTRSRRTSARCCAATRGCSCPR